MNDRTRVINGVTIRDITPELTGEELRKRATEVAEALLLFNKKRNKDKTA